MNISPSASLCAWSDPLRGKYLLTLQERNQGAAPICAEAWTASKRREKPGRIERAFSCQIPDEIWTKMEEEMAEGE